MHLTVAICTWNHSDLLRQTLESLTRLELPPSLQWEVLIVDNNSSDGTKTVADGYVGRLPLRYVHEPILGLCRARNRAIEESTSQYILFTDDDVLVHPAWLSSFWRAALEFPEAAAFGGPVEPWWVRKPDPQLVEVFWRLKIGFCGINHKRPQGILPPELSVFGANMAFRRAGIGFTRFDPHLGQCGSNEKRSDEIDFLGRLRSHGAQVVWVPEMRVQHYVDPKRMTLPYLCRITVGEGRASARLEGLPGVTTNTPMINGVPRWLVRRCAEWRVRVVWYRLAGRRRERLDALRHYCFLRGLISESWLMRRERLQAGIANDSIVVGTASRE